jgi:hypothetical protein
LATYPCLHPSSQYMCRSGRTTTPMKMWTAMNNHTPSAVVAHPAGACLDVAYRLVLVAMVETSEGVRKHCSEGSEQRLEILLYVWTLYRAS